MNLPPHDPSFIVPTDGYWDPNATNGLKAQSAREAMLHYHRERGFDSDEAVCTVDLLTDLLHHLHALGENPFTALDQARKYFEAEVTGTALRIVA